MIVVIVAGQKIMSMIGDGLQAVHARIARAAGAAGRDPGSIRLLAVSKTHAPAYIAEAWRLGQSDFGENYVQEALGKMEALGPVLQEGLAVRPIEWHLVGPLQANKTRAVAERFGWVHSIEQEKTARRLSEQRPEGLPSLNVLLQNKESGEPTKSGVHPDVANALGNAVAGLPRLTLRGLMAVPEPTGDAALQRQRFRSIRMLYERMNASGFRLDTLSLGMSADMEAAIAEGSTLVRIGTAIFGERRTVRSAA